MKNKIFTLVVITAFAFFQCKEKKNHHMGDMANDPQLTENNITKLVKADDLHIAFDFMSMPYHMQMMKLMNAQMKYDTEATHGLMVTVMNYQTKKILNDAKVTLTITTPDGKISQHETEIMHGAGMHHYAIHLNAKEQGLYVIHAEIFYKGRKYSAKTDFELKPEK